ncbi:MAG: imidazole glycerol phosphate synthase subunit HisH [Bernardetiaceae bacterium]|nr:imidazole glycerol phosphate synthase subunit HisH [Bernardetiaceae bacterium]
MQLALIKYNAGNTQSVIYALERLGIQPLLTDDPEAIRAADKVIFPGVGEASTAMNYLKARGLDKLIADLKQPTLGICIGMQVMCRHSAENDTPCMGIFPVDIHRFAPGADRAGLKVPQIGWNALRGLQSPLFNGLADGRDYVYFVHSYFADLSPLTIAAADYTQPFSAALQHNNFYGVQFHPEKSGQVGAKIIQNFIEYVN